MSSLTINARTVVYNQNGAISVPRQYARKGSLVGDVSAPGNIMLASSVNIINNMEIGSILARIIAAGQLNFSRVRDVGSVDISEAYHSAAPILCVLEFVTKDSKNEDTAMLVIFAEKIEKYLSHTKTNNVFGIFERIGLRFNAEGTTIKYGHKSAAVMALIKQIQSREAKKEAAIDATIGAVKGVGAMIRNIRSFL